MDLVTLTIIAAKTQITLTEIVILAVMLLVMMMMGINLMALLFVDGVMKYLSPEVLGVTNRILALLLAALAMETIINATGDLVQKATRQLREMGIIRS